MNLSFLDVLWFCWLAYAIWHVSRVFELLATGRYPRLLWRAALGSAWCVFWFMVLRDWSALAAK